MKRYSLIDYFDVWGNEEDGFWVNDKRKIKSINIPDNSSDEEILNILVDVEFLKTSDINVVEIRSCCENFLEIFCIENDYPLGALMMEV